MRSPAGAWEARDGRVRMVTPGDPSVHWRCFGRASWGLPRRTRTAHSGVGAALPQTPGNPLVETRGSRGKVGSPQPGGRLGGAARSTGWRAARGESGQVACAVRAKFCVARQGAGEGHGSRRAAPSCRWSSGATAEGRTRARRAFALQHHSRGWLDARLFCPSLPRETT